MRLLNRDARPVALAQALFYLNAAIWLAIGGATVVRISSRHPDQAVTAWIITILMLGNVGAMILAGVGLGQRKRGFFYLALVILGVNIFLTFTDQFGLLDLITLVIDLFLFGLLVITRNLYHRGQAEATPRRRG